MCSSQYNMLAAECRRVSDAASTTTLSRISIRKSPTTRWLAGLSTFHFCRVFKQTEGISPHRYVLQCRVQRTQQLLTSTAMSVAEIADAVGFSNQSHCIYYFREIVGVTPGEYRRCYLQGRDHSDSGRLRTTRAIANFSSNHARD